MNDHTHTAFLCHASEDKDAVARPLADILRQSGWDIWLDEAELSVGDSLWANINTALSRSTFGIVILSPSFFEKKWPLRELQALSAKETSSGEKVILPVWHDLSQAEVLARMPLLADRLGARTEGGLPKVAEELITAFGALQGTQGTQRRLLQGISEDPTETVPADDSETSKVSDYATEYRSQVRDRCSRITPPHVDSTRRIAIDELYVAPSLEPLTKSDNEEPQSLSLKDFSDSFSHSVVLGNPGSGKSTLSQKLCYDLASSTDAAVIPVLVVLRDFGVHRAEGLSVVEYVELAASGVHQLPEPPSGAFARLFSEGRCVVIFDGLDELLDATYRQEIAKDVESFCSLYPTVPVLVTSREVGYSQAPLDEKLFTSLRLSDFDAEAVALYAKRWFRSIPDLSEAEGEQLAASFVLESAAVPDLRSNALMLALMCNIYRGERYIPTNRPDVYEKCARMLFERWDRSRGIDVELPFRSHLFLAMQYLAHWIYGDQELQNGVRADALVGKTVRYLLDWQYEDEEEARQAAEQFVDFCAGRAWVFSDAGLTPDGDTLYQFTHRTFLEYFTAAYLARQSSSPGELLDALSPRIALREWDTVAQLALQLTNQSSAGAADQMLDRLVTEAAEADDTQTGWNILAFAARALQFLVPKPQTRRNVAHAVINSLVIGPDGNRKQGVPTRESLDGILGTATENMPAVVDEAEQVLRGGLESDEATHRIRTADLILHHFDTFRPDEAVLWQQLRERLLTEYEAVIGELAEQVQTFAVDWVMLGKMDISDFLRLHGFVGLYQWQRYPCLDDVIGPALGDRLLSWSCFGYPTDKSQAFATALEHLAVYVLQADVPWVSDTEEINPRPHVAIDIAFEDPEFPIPDLTPQQCFGLFCVLAPQVEIDGPGAIHREVRSWLDRKGHVLAGLAPLLLSRDQEDSGTDTLTDHSVELGFSVAQRRFVSDWITGEINLLGG